MSDLFVFTWLAQQLMFLLFSDSEILYNKKLKRRRKQDVIRTDAFDSGDETFIKRQKQSRKSEKIISQQLSESLKSESFNSSMLANLSIESIMMDHENAEQEIEFSKRAEEVRKKPSKRTVKIAEDDEKKLEAKVLLKVLNQSEKVHVLTGRTLLCIIYCALNICRSKIQLTDLLRFIIGGNISYYNSNLLLPEEFRDLDIPLSHEQHHTYGIVTLDSLRKEIIHFALFIPDLASSITMPNLIELCLRYLSELCLPNDIALYIESIMNLIPPQMTLNSLSIPNYEGRALAYIIFVLKLIFGLDGQREEEMSTGARKINNVLENDDTKKLFVYKDWMNFIEYRQEILSRFYHPTLFSVDVPSEKPVAAFKTMMDNINQTTRNDEGRKVKGADQQRVTAKLNAKELITKLSLKHSKNETMGSVEFEATLNPMREYFQQILASDETNLKINRDIATQDFSETSCEAFLEPETFVESCEGEMGIKVQTIKAAFPKSFVLKRQNSSIAYCNGKFELESDEETEEIWRNNLKTRNDKERKGKVKDDIAYHNKQLAQVLEKRKIWRMLINNKKENSNILANKTTAEEEPQMFKEKSVLCGDTENTPHDDTEIEDVEQTSSQLDQIFETHDREMKIQDHLMLVFPDYNFWHKMISIPQSALNHRNEDIESLPQNFLWLLKFCSSFNNQHPTALYNQLLILENQFVNVFCPLELVDNMLLTQKFSGMCRKYIKCGRFLNSNV